MKKTIISAALVMSLMSCTGNSKTETTKDQTKQTTTEQVTEQTPETTALETTDSCCVSEIVGVYEGTLPAASSPGIKTELTLNEDNTFTLLSEYLEEEDGKFTEKGEFKIEDGILITTSEEGTISYFKIEEKQLRMLDEEKQEITDEMAGQYILKKAE